MIEFDHVSFRYPNVDRPALEDISLSIDSGSFVLIGGLSGSGKSTLLRSINGLIPHLSGGSFAGSVQVDGTNSLTTGPRVLSRYCGFVFQNPESQAVADTVEDEIAFSLEQFGIPVSTMRIRVEEVLNLLGIAHLRSRAVTTLSGGERQRLAIAGAMALHPSHLILDEPTSQLDPWGADELVDALVRLNQHLGITILVAEHRLDRLLPVVDRVIWMERGRITVDAPPQFAARQLLESVLPPVVALARRLETTPVPLTIKGARAAIDWTPVALPNPRDFGREQAVVVQIYGITIERGRRRVLDNLSLVARAGEVVALVGPNGSGKTTVLRTIFGFEQPIRGSVVVLGHEMRNTGAQSLGKEAAYLPQRSGAVLFNETVQAELAFTIRHRGHGAGAGKLVERLELAALLDRDPRDLSEGERLRAALGAILVGNPRLVVLDEPTRGLDGEMRTRMIDLIGELRARGACVVVATHDTELAAEIADRVVLLGSGSIVADDTPAVVLGSSMAYATQVARLFGPPWLTLADTGLLTESLLPDNAVGAES